MGHPVGCRRPYRRAALPGRSRERVASPWLLGGWLVVFSMLRKLVGSGRRPTAGRRPPRSVRVQLEAMEDRLLLSRSTPLVPHDRLGQRGTVTVMTYNLDDGADLTPIL